MNSTGTNNEDANNAKPSVSESSPDEEKPCAAARSLKALVNPSIDVVAAHFRNLRQPVKNLSVAIQMTAISDDPANIRLIDKPDEAVQIEAVQRDGYCLTHIANPSRVVQIAALRSCGAALQHIPDPDPDLCLIALATSGMIALAYCPPSFLATDPKKVIDAFAASDQNPQPAIDPILALLFRRFHVGFIVSSEELLIKMMAGWSPEDVRLLAAKSPRLAERQNLLPVFRAALLACTEPGAASVPSRRL